MHVLGYHSVGLQVSCLAQLTQQLVEGPTTANIWLCPKVCEEDVAVDDNLAFAKHRCISRLTEMQSLEYKIAHARAHSPMLLLALQEAQQRETAEPEKLAA